MSATRHSDNMYGMDHMIGSVLFGNIAVLILHRIVRIQFGTPIHCMLYILACQGMGGGGGLGHNGTPGTGVTTP